MYDTFITQVLLFIFCNENLKSITCSFWTRNNWSVLSIKQISEISSEVYDNCLNLSRPGQKKKNWKEKKIASLSCDKAYYDKAY